MQTLRIQNLLKVYSGQDKVVAVDHVDLTVDDGMLLVLLGPSGCGKTTMLRCVPASRMLRTEPSRSATMSFSTFAGG